MTLRLDRAGVVRHLDRLGFPLAPQRRVMCHWSPYLRGGAMTLYAALMRQARQYPLGALQAPEQAVSAKPGSTLPLPWGWKAPS